MAKARLNRAAEEAGLPWGDRKNTFNSRLSQELGKWAESQGEGDPFHNTVFRTYFVDNKNIGKISILVDLAESIGLSGSEAEKILKTRAFKSEVDEDWSRSHAMGIRAVPTFVLDGRHLVGAQPYPLLEQFLLENAVKRK